MASVIQFDGPHTGLNTMAMDTQSCEDKLKAYLLGLFTEPLVFRHKVTEQSKGLISSRTLANYDCAKSDNYPLTKLVYNGKTCYDRDQFVAFLLTRLKRNVGIRGKARIDQLINEMGASNQCIHSEPTIQGEI